ncbi:MAG: DNA repair protein RadA [Acidimicrobiia bacterium]
MKGTPTAEKLTYRCESCGHTSSRWMGFCPQCRSSEGLVETTVRPHRVAPSIDVVSADAPPKTINGRAPTGLGEFDRVLGGGMVPGVTVLVGGAPGIGKSTLLLHAADRFASSTGPVLIATAEESARQVQLRAHRVGVRTGQVLIASVADVDDIVAIAAARKPAAVIVDSIQTVSSTGSSGAAGGVVQVRDCAARLIAFAKNSDTPVIIVGHVTKDGSIAGPRTLEHMVDVVLYLEGESDAGLRFLRSVKNRYGAVHEVGVFDMTPDGLVEVPDPSGLLVGLRDDTAPGSVLFPAIEGRRPVVVEVQALVVGSNASQPRRSVTGLLPSRVHQILGILTRHARIPLAGQEVYLSVMGGVRISEPAADLPVALAVASAFHDVALGRVAAWGELGLTGDVRPAPRPLVRTAEIERISAGPILCPETGFKRLDRALAATGLASG